MNKKNYYSGQKGLDYLCIASIIAFLLLLSTVHYLNKPDNNQRVEPDNNPRVEYFKKEYPTIQIIQEIKEMILPNLYKK